MNYAGSNGGSNNTNEISDTFAHITQGLQFQKHLKNISGFSPEQVVESFVPISQREQAEKIAELNELKAEYIALIKEFEGAGNTLRSGYRSSLQVYPDPNYTNKHVKFGDSNGYVTKRGVFKTYDGSGNDFNGVRGCPNTSERVTVAGTLSSILASLKLTEGKTMYDGQPCGDEGTNVLVTSVITPGITYGGCYQATDPLLSGLQLQPGGQIFNVNSCKQRAVDTGAGVFALRNVDPTLNKANCYTGATYMSPTFPGNAYEGTALWSSKDTPDLSGNFKMPYKMQLTAGGFISILDDTITNPLLVKEIPNTGSPECKIIPVVTTFFVTPTMGTIPTPTPANLFTGTTDAVNRTINPNNAPAFSFPISAIYPNAPETVQNYYIAYKCGDVERKMFVSGTRITQIDIHRCTLASTTGTNSQNCMNYHLILTDDGKMQVNKGLTPSSSGAAANTLFSVSYADKITNSVENPRFSIAGRKTGSNFISSNVPLLVDEYITSDNGKLVLMMRQSGHLILRTFTKPNTCSTRTTGQETNEYGGADSYALYNFNSPIDNSNIGKLAYIDEDGYSYAYPTSMISRDPKSYISFSESDSPGNNMPNMPMTDITSARCKEESDKTVTSGGYVYNSVTKQCWIKNNSFNLTTPKTYAENSYLYVKRPIPNVPISCSDTLTEIDSTRWAQYKSAGNMSSNFLCGTAKKYSGARERSRTIEQELYVMALDILRKMNELQSRGTVLSADMAAFKTQLKNSIDAYNQSVLGVNDDKTIKSALSGMMSDVDLMVLQENTRYLFLSIFAVGVMVVALNAIKK